MGKGSFIDSGAAPTGGQRRLESGARPRTRPPPNCADADDARPLGASATHSKNWQNIASRRRAGCRRPSAHDARRLASWVVHGGPGTRHSLGNGCETRARTEGPPGEVPRGPMEKQGSDEACRDGGTGRRGQEYLHSLILYTNYFLQSYDRTPALQESRSARDASRVPDKY